MTHYFCYQCERAVPIETGENLQCPRCAGDFLEELAANDPRMPSSQPFGMPRIPVGAQSPGRSAGQSIPTHSPNAVRASLLDLLLMARAGAGPLAAMQGPPQPGPGAQPNRARPQAGPSASVGFRFQTEAAPSVGFRFQTEAPSSVGFRFQAEAANGDEENEEDEAVGPSGEAVGVTAAREGEAEEPEDAGNAHPAEEEANEEEGEDEEEHVGGAALAALHRLRTVLMAQQGNENRAVTLENFLEAMGPLLGYYGNPGDYVTQEQYDALISRMMDEKKPDFKPASEDFIEALEKRTYTSTDGQLDCSVCRDDFKEEEVYNVLPCTHLFHKDCITSWLKENNNCPLCRQKFDTKSE